MSCPEGLLGDVLNLLAGFLQAASGGFSCALQAPPGGIHGSADAAFGGIHRCADGAARGEVRIEASWQDYFLPDKKEKWVRVSCTIHAGSAEQHESFMTSRDSGSGRSLVDGLIRFNLSGESHIKVVDADLVCRFEIPGHSLRSMEHPNVDVRPGPSSTPSSNPSPSARPGQSIGKPAQPVKT
mgnify:CR=1 FL=1